MSALEGPSCDKCMYVDSIIDKDSLSRSYNCRRNPPTAVVTAQGQGISFFPPTQPQFACGEFRISIHAVH